MKTASKVISNAATFGVAAAGGTKSIKNIYKNVKQGNVLTKENFAELANIGLSAFTMICSGKNMIASGKELGGMLKEDVPKAWSSVKKNFKTFAADNRGLVEFNAPIGSGSSTTDRIRNVAQQSFDYAVNNPRKQGLNRMQLGKDAEIQATRWTRKWAERNGIDLSESGLHFQVRGEHSIPDVVYEPTKILWILS
ncbi:MAG: hypothetical protein IJA27_03860 [Lachnospiraceae bacterium]|nr:hypothetical protein [Lachnospiraceae bacterium]